MSCHCIKNLYTKKHSATAFIIYHSSSPHPPSAPSPDFDCAQPPQGEGSHPGKFAIKSHAVNRKS